MGKDYTEVIPNKWFHITRRDLGESAILSPSGDFSPIGVSFAPSVRQALDAIPLFFSDEKSARENAESVSGSGKIRRFTFYVYTPIKRYVAIIPDIEDIEVSGERRVLRGAKVRRVGIIDVTSRESWSGRQIYDLGYSWRVI